MKKKSKKAFIILMCGLVGIASAFVTIISDFILLGRPVSFHLFLKLGTESMAVLAQWRIIAGTFLGVFVLPLQIAGLIPLYFGLKPAGKRISLVVVLVAAHALIMGVAFHAAYAFIASGWKLSYRLNSKNAIAANMMKNFDYYWRIIIIIMALEILFVSICYAYLILFKNTRYPKWMAAINPICIFLYVYVLVFSLPEPIGGFIGPAYLNISTIVFFALSTIIIYKSEIAKTN